MVGVSEPSRRLYDIKFRASSLVCFQHPLLEGGGVDYPLGFTPRNLLARIRVNRSLCEVPHSPHLAREHRADATTQPAMTPRQTSTAETSSDRRLEASESSRP